jgi:predicted ferric reductase
MLDKSKTRPIRNSYSVLNYVWLIMTVGAGVLLAFMIMLVWPPLSTFILNLAGEKIFWYFSRATAIVGYGLLWLSTVLGLVVTDKLKQSRTIVNWHQVTSILGLIFAGVHALVLLGDKYMKLDLVQILVPFQFVNYKPFENALGQIGFYLWLIIIISFYIRKLIGRKTWRLIHYATFGSYLMGLTHGIIVGSDTASSLMQSFYWISGGLFLFLLIYRLLSVLLKPVEIPITVSGK